MARNWKDVSPLLRLATSNGIEILRTGSGHLRLVAPDGAITVIAASPGTAKAAYMLKSWLRKRGLKVA